MLDTLGIVLVAVPMIGLAGFMVVAFIANIIYAWRTGEKVWAIMASGLLSAVVGAVLICAGK